MSIEAALNGHYGNRDVLAGILDALRAAGKDVEHLVPDDLALVEEFHIGGRAATLALAEMAGVAAGQRVLDVGRGIGGPARALASRFGCTVVGVDLTEAFRVAGRRLNELVGLADRVEIRHGSALDLPVDDAS